MEYSKTKEQLIEDLKNLQIELSGLQQKEVQASRIQQALREREDQFRTIVENVNAGIYRNTLGPSGRFLQANPAIVAMFGYSSVEEFLNISVASLYQHPEDRKVFVEKIVKQGSVKNEELRLRRKDGTPFWGSVSAKIHCNEEGAPDWTRWHH